MGESASGSSVVTKIFFGATMKKYLRYLGPILITCLFVLAIYLLYRKLESYSIQQIRESIAQVSYVSIALSLVLMVINYGILVGYDWLALKAIHKTLPLQRVGLVSLVGQAVSYNFGALLGGTSVRYRFYSAWGFKLEEIVRLVLMLAVTFWVGALGLCGFVFLICPPTLPPELIEKMPIHDVRLLGAVLLAVALSYIVLCFTVRKPLHIFGREFVFPAPRIALAQLFVAGIDIVAAAACMYVLLPHDIGLSFMDFLPGYLMAQVAVVLTHVPGGVGVFELIILHLTHTPNEKAVVAAVLLFRLIYYIIPLLAAAVLLAVYEARQRTDVLREAGRWLFVLSHSIAAYITFAAGCILLVSATLPCLTPMMYRMSVLPWWLVQGGHFVCALSGAMLLFVSYGLERRQRRAFHLAVIFLSLGIVGALLKSFGWLTAAMVAVILLAVCLAHRRFYRSSFFWEEAVPLYWLVGALGVLLLVFAMGWGIYHPAWDRAGSWGFEQPFNAGRVLRAYIGIAIAVSLSWVWRITLRRRKLRRERRNRLPRE